MERLFKWLNMKGVYKVVHRSCLAVHIYKDYVIRKTDEIQIIVDQIKVDSIHYVKVHHKRILVTKKQSS